MGNFGWGFSIFPCGTTKLSSENKRQHLGPVINCELNCGEEISGGFIVTRGDGAI
jgi:hypothetical protein